jgi:hypothetical protein
MGATCSTNGTDDNPKKFCSEKLKVKYSLEDLKVYGKVIICYENVKLLTDSTFLPNAGKYFSGTGYICPCTRHEGV